MAYRFRTEDSPKSETVMSDEIPKFYSPPSFRENPEIQYSVEAPWKS